MTATYGQKQRDTNIDVRGSECVVDNVLVLGQSAVEKLGNFFVELFLFVRDQFDFRKYSRESP